MGNSSSLTINSQFYFRTNASGQHHSIGSGCTINGTASISWQIATNSILDTFAAYTYTGSGITVINDFTKTGWTLIINGALNIGAITLRIYKTGASGHSATITVNDVNVTCGTFTTGTDLNNTTLTFNAGNGTYSIANFNQSTYNAGSTTFNAQGSIWNCNGAWLWGNSFTRNMGTSIVNLTNTATITSAGTPTFYDVAFAPGSGKAVTLADSLIVNGDLTCTNGNMTQASKPVKVTSDVQINSGGTYTMNGAWTCGGNWTWGASSAATITGMTLLLNGAGTITNNGKTYAIPITQTSTGQYTLADAISCLNYNLTSGVFDLNSKTMTTSGSQLFGTDSTDTIKNTGNGAITCTINDSGNVVFGANSGHDNTDAFTNVDSAFGYLTNVSWDLKGNDTIKSTYEHTFIKNLTMSYSGKTCVIEGISGHGNPWILMHDGTLTCNASGTLGINGRIFARCYTVTNPYQLNGCTLLSSTGNLYLQTWRKITATLPAINWPGNNSIQVTGQGNDTNQVALTGNITAQNLSFRFDTPYPFIVHFRGNTLSLREALAFQNAAGATKTISVYFDSSQISCLDLYTYNNAFPVYIHLGTSVDSIRRDLTFRANNTLDAAANPTIVFNSTSASTLTSNGKTLPGTTIIRKNATNTWGMADTGRFTILSVDSGVNTFNQTAVVQNLNLKCLTDTCVFTKPIYSDTITIGAAAKVNFSTGSNFTHSICDPVVTNTWGGTLPPRYYPTVGPITYAQQTMTLTVGSAATPNTVTNGGCTIDSFAVAPALSTGLSLNTSTGTISGTPTVAQGATAYIFTAYVGASTAKDTVTITVNGCISSISYADSPISDTLSKAKNHSVTLGGCTPDSIVAITALPTGYTLTKTGANIGRIAYNGAGTSQSATNYTIRAYGSSKTDSASVVVSIAIKSAGGKKRIGLWNYWRTGSLILK
jgi:hypothetical protein